jgi:hypothetical protein
MAPMPVEATWAAAALNGRHLKRRFWPAQESGGIDECPANQRINIRKHKFPCRFKS